MDSKIMKPFTKRLALVTGLLFTALICMGIVYIDTTQNYWYVNGGFVKLIVSNQTGQAVFTVSTNTFSVGFNTNNTTRSFVVAGKKPLNEATGTGTASGTAGGITMVAGAGGDTTNTTVGTGGAGAVANYLGGPGGLAPGAVTNSTGGGGGAITVSGGTGGTAGPVATNNATGGNGGGTTISGGTGGSADGDATNNAAGNGGTLSLNGGTTTTLITGWSRKSGNSGPVNITSMDTAAGRRTNSGDVGPITLLAGNSGAVTVAPGNPGKAGVVNITAGNGGTGDTNANGGNVFLRGGNPGSTATPGNTYIGRNSAGSARGGLVVGLGEATVTNVLSATATLDFPSLTAGTVADLAVTLAGAAAGDVVTLAVPLESVTNCMWMGFASNGVVWVRAANGQLVTAQDPNSGTFRVVCTKFQ